MEKLKLISVRIEPETLRKLDELARKHEYYNRSSILNRLLKAILTCSAGGTIFRMISEFYPYEKGYVCKFEKSKEAIELRHKPNYDD